MRHSTDYEESVYGILARATHDHRIKGAKHNRRARFMITVWDNTIRPNPHPGEVKYLQYGSIGGDGQWLDPHNRGTDDEISVTTSAQATCITSSRVRTGPEEGVELAIDQTVMLRLPGGEELGPYVIRQKALHDPHLELVPPFDASELLSSQLIHEHVENRMGAARGDVHTAQERERHRLVVDELRKRNLL